MGGGGRWNGSPTTDDSRDCRTVAMSLITETICDDGVAEHVPTSARLSAASRRCESGWRRSLRARLMSPARHSLLGMNDTFEVFAFCYRDARTGKWAKARYKATPEEIAARYAEWEILGVGEVRRPIGGYFNPDRREGE